MLEKISIQGKGKLSAYIQKPHADYRGPIAVLMHGFMANKKLEPLKSVAKELENRGIASLRFDFDGHGESEGRFRDMTVLTELDDARHVINRPGRSFTRWCGSGHDCGRTRRWN